MSTILLAGSAFLLVGAVVVIVFVGRVAVEFVGLWLRSLRRPRRAERCSEVEPDEPATPD